MAERNSALVADRRTRDEWDRGNPTANRDQTHFRNQVLPLIAATPLSDIVRVTGLSVSAASRVRSGALTPHARHWAPIESLVRGVVTGR